MPLIILGLLLLIGLLAYTIVRYISSGEEDTRPVRERYPKAFRVFNGDNEEDVKVEHDESSDDEPIYAEGYVETDSFMGDIDHIVRNIKETVKDKAKEHGIDLDKWGRDPLDHNPFGKSDSKGQRSGDDSNDQDKGADDEIPKDIPEDADQANQDDGTGDATIIFPTDNVEAEKNKRNIH